MAALDLDGGTLYHVLSGGHEALVEAMSMGVRPEYMDGKAAKALTFIADHHATHQMMPGIKDVESLFGGVVAQNGLARGFVFGELMRRALFRRVSMGVDKVDKALKANDPEGALALLLKAGEQAKEAKAKHKPPVSMFALGQAVKAEYDLMKAGGMGIPSPWKSVNAMTMGWWPGTNNWFLARPGTGKTWLVLVCADHAWSQRFNTENPKELKILIVSPEMLKAQLAERFFTLKAQLPYGEVVGASLGAFSEKKFKGRIDDLSSQTGIWVMDQTDDLSPAHIEEACDELEADMLVIDAAYKVRWKERARDRFENMYEGVDRISNWSKRKWRDDKKITVLADSQMNRAGDKKGGMKQSSVALADNLNWEADTLFFVEQNEDLKADQRLWLHTGKVRRMAEFKSKVVLNWDMTTMNFGEYGETKTDADAWKDPGFDEDAKAAADEQFEMPTLGF